MVGTCKPHDDVSLILQSNPAPLQITVLFPFGVIENLSQVAETLRSALASSEPFRIKLDKVARFSTRDYETVHLGTSNPAQAQALWSTVIKAMKHKTNGRSYIPHMTLGQTTRNSDSIAFLTEKGNKLIERHDISWLVDSVALLRKREDQGGYMEVYAQIPIGPLVGVVPRDHTPFGTPTYFFDGARWIPKTPTTPTSLLTSLTVATYNLLHDSAFPFSSRFPHVLDAILESNADVICLQESTDESISLILQDEQIRQIWPWCTRHEMAVMESERNVVMLAKEEFGFEWVRLELGGKHKACVIAHLRLSDSQHDKPIVIAGVHLTAGRTPLTLDKKRDEIAKLLTYLRLHQGEDDWIIIGDVNWPSDKDFPGKDVLVDVWAETIGEGGATYDPTSNPLAAATARESRTPERYDRIFVKKGGRLVVGLEGLALFGMPGKEGRVGSDHWGLKAVFQFNDRQASQANDAEASRTPAFAPTLELLPTNLGDDQLQEFCAEKGCIPSEARNGELQNAVNTLRGFLTNTSSPSTQSVANDDITTLPSVVRLVVVPVGSFAIGYHTTNSDVDCVVIGNINSQTFWSLVRWKIHVAGSSGRVKLRRFVKDALVQMMELDVEGIKIDLQYCPAAKLVEWYFFSSIFFIAFTHLFLLLPT
jgi:2'-5' RNA ligase/endonuclease/exonuclease/phosphatase family metal-dependent hydrolase